MGEFEDLKSQGEKLAADHPEQTEKYSDDALQKGAEAADKATGDKFSNQVEGAEQKADDAIGS
jgi:MT0933-like antitoxin protein